MFIFSIASIFIFAYIFLEKTTKNGKLYFLLFSGAILCLYAGLRGHDLQVDIPGYVRSYEQYARYSFKEIISLYSSDKKDPTYYFTAWLFSRFFTNAQWWLAFVAALYIVSAFVLIYKESVNPLMSITMIISLGYFAFILSGLRQSIAISIIMLAYFHLKNSKPIRFIAMVLFASLFHFSAIIFLLAYPICRIKFGVVHFIVAIAIFLLFFVLKSSARDLLEIFLMDSQYEGYVDSEVKLNFTGFIIQIFMFAFNLVYYKRVLKSYPCAIILYNLAFIGLIFQLFSSMIAEFFRLSYYFSFANILLVPLSIKCESDRKVRDFLTLMISLLFVIYMFRDGIPKYSFFW